MNGIDGSYASPAVEPSPTAGVPVAGDAFAAAGRRAIASG